MMNNTFYSPYEPEGSVGIDRETHPLYNGGTNPHVMQGPIPDVHGEPKTPPPPVHANPAHASKHPLGAGYEPPTGSMHSNGTVEGQTNPTPEGQFPQTIGISGKFDTNPSTRAKNAEYNEEQDEIAGTPGVHTSAFSDEEVESASDRIAARNMSHGGH